MLPDQVWQEASVPNGFISRPELGMLYWAATQWPSAGPVVELGSYEGRSSLLFARGGRHVHCVDAWGLYPRDESSHDEYPLAETFDLFSKHIQDAGVQDQITVHRGKTTEVCTQWSTKAAILLIDAGHSYEETAADLAGWSPFLNDDGLLLVHDVLASRLIGVTAAVSDFMRSGWRVTASTGRLVALERT